MCSSRECFLSARGVCVQVLKNGDELGSLLKVKENLFAVSS
jgi:hypothetical protein